MSELPRIYLSPPHMSGREQAYVAEAFETNWLAPVGPHLTAFEAAFCEYVGCAHAVALASGTAALHLGLELAGVGPGDEVLVATYTFCASVNPILYLGATPVFVDCEPAGWGMDPALVERALAERAAAGRPVKAVMLVHLYGQCADIAPIAESCARHGAALVEDAAEALGSRYGDRHPGTFGRCAGFSFNGNKIITTTGGGMLASDDAALIDHARKLATQARDPAPHYQHTEIGYNYRLSNVLAGIGRGQLEVLEDRVSARRALFEGYRERLAGLPGLTFQAEADWGKHTRWMIVVRVDAEAFGADRSEIQQALEAANIEARPTWKPMHLQPVYEPYELVGDGALSEQLFREGLCLPAGSAMTEADLDRVCAAIRAVHESRGATCA